MPNPPDTTFMLRAPEPSARELAERRKRQRVITRLDHLRERHRLGFPHRGMDRVSRLYEAVDSLLTTLSARFNPRATPEERHRALGWAARKGKTRRVRRILARYPDIHAFNDAALVLAAAHDHPKTVRLLLDRGADPSGIDTDSLRPLRLSERVVQVLREHESRVTDPGQQPRPAA